MAIYLIVLMCALNHAGFGGSRVAVSLYALELGANQFAIGMLMALYGLCPMLLAVSIGKLADRIGPRLPMLMGTLGISLALALPPLFPGLATLYLAALLVGTSFHFFFITVTGIAGGFGGPGNRVRNYALVSLGFSGAGFLGPMATGFSIDHLGYLPSFVLLASFPLVPALLLLFRPGFLPLPADGMRRTGSEKHSTCGASRFCATPSSRAASSRRRGTSFSSTCRSTATRSACPRRQSAWCSAFLRRPRSSSASSCPA